MKKEGRINLRVDRDLEMAIKDYAERHGTTVSKITESYYIRLLNEERAAERHVEEVRQI
jgi:predicted DNA binding CopG/RHH family protein